MPMLTALTALLVAGQSGTVVLQRGLEVKPLTGLPAYKYWTVDDTTLDIDQPETPQGASSTLVGGDGRTILIDFRDIARAIGPNMKIDAADLTLGYIKGDAKLKTVRLVKKPWNEGPLNTIGGLLRGTRDPGVWAATYRSRRIGVRENVPWQANGARGDEDSENYTGATLERVDDLTFKVTGLAGAVQKRVDRPQDYYGLALLFETKVDFLSGNSTIDRPKLTISASPVSPKKGPDLAVTLIERSPEYPRLEDPPVAGAKRWPADGEEVTYTAHIKNIGDATAETFDGQWLIDDAKPEILSSQVRLEPGQETTLQIKTPFKNVHIDHRITTAAFKLFVKGEDANRANNRLEIAQNGLCAEIVVPKALYEQIAGTTNLMGSKSFEDWAQYQISALNDTYFNFSRFSIAPNGILERVRLQKITVADSASPNPNVDIQLLLGKMPVVLGPDVELIREMAKQMGLVELPSLGRPDRFPGILGYGDSRADVVYPPTATIATEPDYNPIYDQEVLEGTGLFSMTEAAALMSNLGKRSAVSGDYLYDVPPGLILDLRDIFGKPITDADVVVTQVVSGVEGPSLFQGKPTVSTNSETKVASGSTVTVPPQPAPGETTATEHVLKNNPFGAIDRAGGNGLLRVKVTTLGVTVTSDIKIWQLVNAFHRGQKAVVIHQLRLNVPTKPIAGVDLAAGKANSANVDLPAQKDQAVEIDFGGDFTIGRVTLAGSPYRNFDILVRSEGQDPKAANLFFRDLDSTWRMTGSNSVDYYGNPIKGRYLRIVNRGTTGGKLEKVSVFAVQ